jgi:hypothetical protein
MRFSVLSVTQESTKKNVNLGFGCNPSEMLFLQVVVSSIECWSSFWLKSETQNYKIWIFNVFILCACKELLQSLYILLHDYSRKDSWYVRILKTRHIYRINKFHETIIIFWKFCWVSWCIYNDTKEIKKYFLQLKKIFWNLECNITILYIQLYNRFFKFCKAHKSLRKSKLFYYSNFIRIELS